MMMMRGHMGRLGEEEGGQIYDHQVVARLSGYLWPHWRLLLVTVVAIVLYTCTVVALPWTIKWAIDSYIRVDDLSGLDLVILIYLLIAGLQFGTNYIHLRLMAYLGQGVLYTLRMALFKHLQRLSMSYHDRHEVGAVMSRVQNDVQQLQEFLSIGLLSLADLLSLSGIIAAMFLMSPRLAAIALMVVPLLILILIVWQRYARISFKRVRTAIANVNSGLQENISGVRVIQSLNRERANSRRFERANHEHLDANLQAGRFSSVLIPSVEVLTALGLALIVYFGGAMVLDGTLEVGALVAFALYIQRFFDPVRNLTMQYSQLQRAMVSGARIFELLDEEPDVRDQPGASELDSVRGEIDYKGVGFQYEDGSPVLRDVDLHVSAGETVAVVGPTGAGKTTLVSLLLRLYDATAGQIIIDGHDIRDVTLDSLACQMGVVTQEPLLFSGTISDNIRFNRTEATEEDVKAAARAVGAHEFISKLEHRYNTPLQERGGNLSIGQRQLVSFARALVADPRILILDEATANIDTYTEMLIQQALEELLMGRTALVIAHRLSTVRNADRIIVVDEGSIAEQGTHSQLMDLNGVYARLQTLTVNRDESCESSN